MCEPVTIAAGIAVVAGTLMSSAASAAQQQATIDADADSTNRATAIAQQSAATQDALSAKARAQVDQQVQAQSAPVQAVASNADATVRQGQYNANTDTVSGDYLPSSPDAPKIISDQTGQKLASALDTVKGENAAKAKLDAMGDMNVQNQISNAESTNKVNQFQNFRLGQYGAVLPAQYAANNAKTAAAKANAQTVDAGLKTAGAITTKVGELGANPGAGDALDTVANPNYGGVSNMFNGLNWNGMNPRASTSSFTGVGGSPY